VAIDSFLDGTLFTRIDLISSLPMEVVKQKLNVVLTCHVNLILKSPQLSLSVVSTPFMFIGLKTSTDIEKVIPQ
jgi:hypothetical protein